MPEHQFVRCPSCNSTFSVPRAQLSLERMDTVRCSFCGEEVQVAAPLSEDSQNLPVWIDEEWGDEERSPA